MAPMHAHQQQLTKHVNAASFLGLITAMSFCSILFFSPPESKPAAWQTIAHKNAFASGREDLPSMGRSASTT